MDILLSILVVFALSFGLVVTLPMFAVGVALLSFMGAVVIWLLPTGSL